MIKMPGLLGEKLGMTQVFTSKGSCVPVTVLRAGPCPIVTKKISSKDGYDAVQIGYQEIDSKKRSKPYAGHFTKKNLKVCRFLREVRSKNSDQYSPGDILTVSQFQEGDIVDVVGQSKGKGFQGVMKRYHFGGGTASHGCSVSHRSGGSVGQCTWPSKVFKGKKMPGQMGNKKVTVRNLKVVGVEAKENIILIQGSVPGPNHSMIMIVPKKGDFEKRFLEQKSKPEKDISS